MSSRITRLLGLTTGLAAIALLFASQASAAPTFTVKAGSATKGTTVALLGKTAGTSPQIKFTDTTSKQALTCASGTAPGAVKVGSKLGGTKIGTVNGPKTTWKTCKGPAQLVFTVKGINTWNINAVSYGSGVTTGTITNIKATVTDPGVCSFTATGSVKVKYTNKTHVLSVPGNSGLTISNASGCFGLIKNTDHASFTAKYLLTANTKAFNPITITSP